MTEEEQKELDALKARLEKLEKAADPPPRKQSYAVPHDHTAGASMPASAVRAMIEAIPDHVMQGLRSDARKPNPVTQGDPPQPQRRGSGWRESAPLTSPAGIAHVDRLVEAQDRLDRADLAMKMANAGML